VRVELVAGIRDNVFNRSFFYYLWERSKMKGAISPTPLTQTPDEISYRFASFIFYQPDGLRPYDGDVRLAF
jgi:hypothetical protein